MNERLLYMIFKKTLIGKFYLAGSRSMFDSFFLCWAAFLQNLGTANIYIPAELEAWVLWAPRRSWPCWGRGVVFPSDSDVQLGCFVWGVGFCLWLPQKWLGSGPPPNREAQKAFISQCQHLQSFSGEVFGYFANMEINSYKSVFCLPENCPCKHWQLRLYI